MSDSGISKGSLWTGRIISGLVTAFLLFDGGAKIARIKPVLDAFNSLGYNPNLSVPIGVTLVLCAAIYAIPRTSVLGAILLTGYLGGATATHVRAGQPFYFPIVFGVLVWVGLYLRESRLKALVPLRS
jgi:hypothetical protein